MPAFLKSPYHHHQSSYKTTGEREYVSLLDYKLNRTDETISICSWCKKLNIDKNIWVEAEVVDGILKDRPKLNLPKLSHTACPACYNGLMVIISA